MTTEDKITTVRALIGDEEQITDAVVCVYLNLAADQMLKRLYPFDSTRQDIPETYAVMQCELASRMYLRRGAEGEIQHNENGINRGFKTAGYDDILNRIQPYVGRIPQ